jgi:glycosidase
VSSEGRTAQSHKLKGAGSGQIVANSEAVQNSACREFSSHQNGVGRRPTRYRHKDLGSLADFSHENGTVVASLEKAANFWKAKGVDGFRHDATLHMDPAYVKGLRDAIDSSSGGPVTHFSEFFYRAPRSEA